MGEKWKKKRQPNLCDSSPFFFLRQSLSVDPGTCCLDWPVSPRILLSVPFPVSLGLQAHVNTLDFLYGFWGCKFRSLLLCDEHFTSRTSSSVSDAHFSRLCRLPWMAHWCCELVILLALLVDFSVFADSILDSQLQVNFLCSVAIRLELFFHLIWHPYIYIMTHHFHGSISTMCLKGQLRISGWLSFYLLRPAILLLHFFHIFKTNSKDKQFFSNEVLMEIGMVSSFHLVLCFGYNFKRCFKGLCNVLKY